MYSGLLFWVRCIVKRVVEARKSGTPCFFVSIPTIKYLMISLLRPLYTMKIMLIENYVIIKPGAPATGRRAPGFLKSLWCGRQYACLCVYVYVCVSAPEAMNN